MRHNPYRLFFTFTLLFFVAQTASAQNVGVDVATPLQKLDVLGGIRIGNTTTGLAGSIRWTGTQFEGHDGSAWAPFGGAGTAWSLTGNSGTNPATNFIGTTDGQSFRIKVNNQNSGYIDYATPFSASFGYQALKVNTGVNNAAFGYQALQANTSGVNNTAVGKGTLGSNTTGSYNTAMGDALKSNTTGQNNTAIGDGAVVANTTGSSNTGIGGNALNTNTTGSSNTAVGVQAIEHNTTGPFNSAVGFYALRNNTTGTANVAMGYVSLVGNTTGQYNVSIGSWAGHNNITGSNNTYLGYSAGYGNTGSNSVFIGYSAGYNETASNRLYIANSNTSTPLIYGEFDNNILGINGNLGVGTQAPTQKLDVNGKIQMRTGATTGYVPVSDANGTMTWTDPATVIGAQAWKLTGNTGTVDGTNFIGSTDDVPLSFRVNNQKAGRIDNATGAKFNTFLGYQSGNATTGVSNTAMGYQALRANIGGGANTAIGYRALELNTTGLNNTALGYAAVGSNTTGLENTGVGFWALTSTTGNSNTAVGINALKNNTTGSDNTALGRYAGYDSGTPANSNTTGTKNTFIGSNAGYPNSTQRTNATAIGYNAKVDASNAMVLGGTGVDAVNVGIGTTTPGQTLDVNGKIQMRTGATTGFVPVSDANGTMTWTNPTSLTITETDPQVNSVTTNYIPKWNGTALVDGAAFDNGTNIGIGTTTPAQALDVNGKIQMRTGATTGYVPVSDANGTMTWTDPTTLPSSNNAWKTTGNSGTTPGTNFIGTTDNKDLVFKTNNGIMGYLPDHSNSAANIFFGNQPAIPAGGDRNTAFGFHTISSGLTGSGNVSVGWNVLDVNTSGSYNTASGFQTMTYNTTGSNNTTYGGSALFNNTTGGSNTAIGMSALNDNITGSSNTALGANAGQSALGSGNVFLGKSAGQNETGSNKLYIDNSNTANPLIYGDFSSDIVNINGNLGVGTAGPADKLHVAGKIRMVDGNQTAGYVPVSDANGTMTWTNPSTVVGAQAWKLTGNSGTTPATNFIGTTDNVDFRIRTNNTERVTVTAGGNLGIGTTTVSTLFGGNIGIEIKGDVPQILFNDNVGGSTDDFRIQNGGAYASFDNATTNTPVIAIGLATNTNNVGIGTTSPADKLHVVGNIRMVDGNEAAGKVLVSDANGTGTWTAATSLTITETDPQVSSTTTNYIPKWNGTTLVDGVAYDNGTNIGIGTTGPVQLLDVNGTGLFRNGNTSAVFTNNQLLFGYSGTANYQHAVKSRHNSGGTSGNAMDFYVWDHATQSGSPAAVGSLQVMTMAADNGGSVGIGTTSPAQKLDVNGKIQMRTGATTGYVPVSDANGTMTWTNPTSLTITETDPQVSSATTNYIPKWNGTTLVDGTVYDNGNVGIGTTNPTSILSFGGDANRTVGMERTTGTDGFDLTIQAGGAKAGTSDNDGGDLILSSGITTGNGSITPGSRIIFKTATPLGSSSSADQLPSEKMRLTANGRLGINETGPDSKLHVTDGFVNFGTFVATIENTGNGGGSNGLLVKAGENSHTGNSRYVQFNRPDGTQIGSIIQNGSSSVAYQTTSDIRLKTNLALTNLGLNDLMKIKVYHYEYKEDLGKKQVGFIAQELYELLPSAVSVGGDDAKTEPWMVDYSKLTPLLVKAVQDLNYEKEKQISEKDKQIQELQRQIDELKQLINK